MYALFCQVMDGPPLKNSPTRLSVAEKLVSHNKYHSHTRSPPATDGLTLGKVFSKSVKADKWTKKGEETV